MRKDVTVKTFFRVRDHLKETDAVLTSSTISKKLQIDKNSVDIALEYLFSEGAIDIVSLNECKVGYKNKIVTMG